MALGSVLGPVQSGPFQSGPVWSGPFQSGFKTIVCSSRPLFVFQVWLLTEFDLGLGSVLGSGFKTIVSIFSLALVDTKSRDFCLFRDRIRVRP